MVNGYIIPLVLDEEINQLETLIRQFEAGEISATQLKAHRVPFGVYEQRQHDTYMVRIRCAAGIITPLQLQAVALIADAFGKGTLHITSRQELQIHDVKLHDLITVIRKLKDVGLSTRGGGGNTVRNIVCPEDAGTGPEEVFDVSPYAMELTNRLIAENDSWALPRKYKIAFSGSPQDKGLATVADLGFIAKIKNGKKGFRVYAAGGMGASSRVGGLLMDFIDDTRVYAVAKAIKNLFSRYGDRKNKHAARLRFLWQTLGEEEFRRRFQEELGLVDKENLFTFKIASSLENAPRNDTLLNADLLQKHTVSYNDIGYENPGFLLWKKRYVHPQKQQGFYTVTVPIELGFLSCQQAVELARFLDPLGKGVLRMTRDQNFFLRDIAGHHLGSIYEFLRKNFISCNQYALYGHILSCAGASTCQLGICLSRQAAKAVLKTLKLSDLDLDKVEAFRLNLSGCPNSCGQHPVADLGFSGKAMRKDGQMYPAYMVHAGAVVYEGKTKLAERIGDIPARNLPMLVKDFLKTYIDSRAEEQDIRSFIAHGGIETLKKLVDRYKEPAAFEDDKNYYFDWDADKPFSLAERRGGECSAGLFDLIGVDLSNIRQTRQRLSDAESSLKVKLLDELLYYSSRMLLITKGVEPKTSQEAFVEFRKHFIETGLVNKSFDEVLIKAAMPDFNAVEREKEILALGESVESLYEGMDNSFNLKKSCASSVKPEPPADHSKADLVKDLRGVRCPLNFVKTKLELSKIRPGEVLEIWLDDGAPIDNVPGSVQDEGHTILEKRKDGQHWIVLIRKKQDFTTGVSSR